MESVVSAGLRAAWRHARVPRGPLTGVRPFLLQGRAAVGVLLFHTAAGPADDFVFQQAEALLERLDNAAVFVADMFGAAEGFVTPPRSTALMAALRERRAAQAERAALAARALREACPEVAQGRLAAVGYCYGGQVVLDLARAQLVPGLKAVGSMHGMLGAVKGEDIAVEPMGATRVLACHGALDPFVTQEDVADFEADMSARDADWTLHTYGEAMHAFTRPDKTTLTDHASGFHYSARRANEAMAAFVALVGETCS